MLGKKGRHYFNWLKTVCVMNYILALGVAVKLINTGVEILFLQDFHFMLRTCIPIGVQRQYSVAQCIVL